MGYLIEVQTEGAEQEEAPALGFFFRGAGALRFHDSAEEEVPGSSQTVAVADRFGIVVFSDLKGVYVAATNDLLQHASSDDPQNPPVVDPAAVRAAHLPLAGVHLLALSADQQLLACVAGGAAHLYSLSQLAAAAPRGGAAAPLHTLRLSAEILDFAWCPSGASEDLGAFLALTADRQLQRGALGGGGAPPAAVAECVDAFSWAPDGQHFAYSAGAQLVVTAPAWQGSAFKVAVGSESAPPGDPVLESIRWVAPRAILATLVAVNPDDSAANDDGDGQREEEDQIHVGITWERWDGTEGAAPEGVQATELGLYYMGHDEEHVGCGHGGWPYLKAAYVKEWQLGIYAHRKAMDEYVLLAALGEGSFATSDGRPADLAQTDTAFKAAVPLLPDDEANFVTGLAVDYSNAEPLEHPRDPEKNLPPVPGSCVLLLATIDGALRLYRLANFEKPDGLARAPEAPPAGAAPWIAQAVAAEKRGAAAATEDEEVSDNSVSSPLPPAASPTQQQAAAARAAAAAAAERRLQQRRRP